MPTRRRFSAATTCARRSWRTDPARWSDIKEVDMVTLKRVLVATDFGEAADVALAYGRELARTFGASIDVLHVADNVLARGYAAESFMASYPELQRDVEEAAARRL